MAGVTDFSMSDPGTFRPYVGTDFIVGAAEAPVPLRLVDVADDGISNGMQQFSLFFHGPPDRRLPDGIHAMAHAALGTLEIFIVPVVGSNADRIIYQACFSAPARPVDNAVK